MPAASKYAERQPHTSSNPQEDFLDLAGHELRTPITALRGQAQLLQRRLRAQPDRSSDAETVDKMMYQIERLNSELDVYLDAAHVFQGRFELLPTECDLVAIARKLVDIYSAGVSTHIVRLETEVEEIIGVWDRKRLHMALAALLSNAVKYSGNSEVIVRVQETQPTVRIEVLDVGAGVPPSERRRIFAPYEHGSNVAHAGAGLGLFVTRAIVKRHHGRIGVRARSGGGSIFWFTLPLAPSTPNSHAL